MKMSRGWIYCMSNKAFPTLLKIGQTKNLPTARAEQLYSTGVPYPFKIEFAKKIENYEKREKIIHSILEKITKRVNPKREFFEASVRDVRPIFDLIDGDDYIEVPEEECLLLKHILIDGQKIKHTLGQDERVSIYSKKDEKLKYKEKSCGFMQFGKIHCDELKKKESISMAQFHIEIEKTFVPITTILKNSAY